MLAARRVFDAPCGPAGPTAPATAPVVAVEAGPLGVRLGGGAVTVGQSPWDGQIPVGVGPGEVEVGAGVPDAAPIGGALGPGRSLWAFSGVNTGSPIPAITSPATSATSLSRTTAFL